MEIWKDIKGYEGIYQVSNKSRVRNIIKKTIKAQVISKTGYWVCNLWKNNISKVYKVHRLVAIAFIDNPQKKKTVNHIDGIKANNDIKNLEWATQKENMQHAKRMGFMKNKYKYTGKTIDMFTYDGVFVRSFDNYREVYNFFGVKIDGVIYKVINGQKKGMRGYTFKYAKQTI